MSGSTDSYPLLILGTRTLAEEVADIVSDGTEYHVAGFVENMNRDRCEAPLDGLPVYWIDDVHQFSGTHFAVCALGTTRRFRFTAEAAERGLRFATIVHPLARVSRRAVVGEGSVLGPGAIVGTRSQVGKHVFVNRGALIGHHTRIGDHVSVMPGANIAGNCVVGDRCYIGMGAAVIDNLEIGNDSIVGAGAVVTKNVPARVQVVGVPARIVRHDVEGR